MEAGGHGMTSKPIKNRLIIVVCVVFDFISRLNFLSRRIAHTVCNFLKSTFSRKLGETKEEKRNNFSKAFSYCFFLSFKKRCWLRRFLLYWDSTALWPCSLLFSHFRNCTAGEQGCLQPRHSPPVTSAFQSRDLQEIRYDCALGLLIFLPAAQMRLICLKVFN